MSYADMEVSDGSLYKHLGFELTGETPVDYKYVYHEVRRHKFNFRISRFRDNPELYFQEGMTEAQLARLNGLRRVYDCGKLRYEKVVSLRAL